MVDEDRFCSHCGVQQQDLGYDQKSKSQITFLGRVWEFIMFCLKLTFAFCVGLIILGVVGNQFLTKDANQINSANRLAGDALPVRAVSKPPDVSQEEIEKKRLAKQRLEEEWAEQVKANKEKKEREEREKQEQERIAKEKMEQERLAKEQE
jgi:hypothetical protein